MSRRLYLVLFSVMALTVAGLAFACDDPKEDVVGSEATTPPAASTSTPGDPAETPLATNLSATPPVTASVGPTELVTYEDPGGKIAVQYRRDLSVKEEEIELMGKSGNPPVLQRIITFSSTTGIPGVRLGIAPNPSNLTLDEWVTTYPGWSTEPTESTVAGERALIFWIGELGEPDPVIYFQHSGTIFGITRFPSNTEVGGELKPVVSEGEFQAILSSIEFPG